MSGFPLFAAIVLFGITCAWAGMGLGWILRGEHDEDDDE